jgi:hypothetical protein
MTEKLVQFVEAQAKTRMDLHKGAMEVAANFRRCEADLFQILFMVEAKQVYYDLGITSLFQYAVEMLRLSRHTAYDYITVVRKSKEIEALHKAVLLEQVTVSRARRICSVINEKNANEWIGLATHCTSREVEKAVAMANPRSAIQEKMTYKAENVLQFQLAVSEEWAELLKDVKDLLSQKNQRAVSSEEALFILMTEYKAKNDPVSKAERAQKKSDPTEESNSARKQNHLSRKIPAANLHVVNARDKRPCTHVDQDGNRCQQKRWLQVHHLRQFSDGGSHLPENLKTLCFAHHAMEHQQP